MYARKSYNKQLKNYDQVFNIIIIITNAIVTNINVPLLLLSSPTSDYRQLITENAHLARNTTDNSNNQKSDEKLREYSNEIIELKVLLLNFYYFASIIALSSLSLD